MDLEDRYRKLINDRHGKKLPTSLFQVSQSPYLYLTEKEIRTAIKRAGKLFDVPEPVPNPTLIIARDGTIHRKGRGKKAVPVRAGSYPDKKRGEQIKIIAENPETGHQETGILRSYYCEKCKRRHFDGTRTFVTHFDYAGLTL